MDSKGRISLHNWEHVSLPCIWQQTPWILNLNRWRCLSTVVYSLSLSLNVSDQQALCGRGALPSTHCMREGGCQQRMHEHDRHFSDTPLGSDWLCWFGSGGFLQIKLRPQGGATDSGFFYTVDLHLILQSHHNEILSKYNTIIAPDYNFKGQHHFILFHFGYMWRTLPPFKQCSEDFLFLWEQLVYSVVEYWKCFVVCIIATLIL